VGASEGVEEGDVEEGAGASRGGRGRKLHALAGRLDTRAKIWERRRCWVCVSYERREGLESVQEGGR
jgi:hypothetical protein